MRQLITVTFLGVILTACFAATPGSAQQPYPQQYPPAQQQPYPQQYPPAQQQQYPQQYPQQQYPQGQYPPPQGQYPPPQYPPGQGYPQPQYGPPPVMAPQQLDQLVSRIALYPDGLLAEVLTASTFSNQIPDAARWADEHAYLHGDELARAIQDDRLPFDPSVLALIPFPSVLDEMARDMSWTQALGNAVLAQRPDIMDAVQRMRQEAYNYGYLRSNQYVQVIASPGYIEILPVNPGYYYVPAYDPRVVYVRPRPGFYVGSAIRFGPGIVIGAGFSPFGWGGAGFGWHEHNILIDHHPWDRTWANRTAYVHPYAERPHYNGPQAEHHDYHAHEEHRDGHDEHHDHH
ncbi:MAG: DUF3300 domain-containing protein [Acidobacteriaceae bacterium]|nr:DUF3300 domain-containing protein [Acidobacteriaceae bacterium]